MIGRFSNLGDYRGLFSFKDFAVCLGGGALALVAWILGENGWGFWAGAFALAAVAINGAPIVVEAAKGARTIKVDEASPAHDHGDHSHAGERAERSRRRENA